MDTSAGGLSLTRHVFDSADHRRLRRRPIKNIISDSGGSGGLPRPRGARGVPPRMSLEKRQ